VVHAQQDGAWERQGLTRGKRAHNTCHLGTFSQNINTIFSTVFRTFLAAAKPREGE
jgi:hypothetical protein